MPTELGNLEELDTLDLREIELVALAYEIGYLSSLRSLDLRRNRLRSLPAEIGNLRKLKELYLYGNPLPASEKERIRQWLPQVKMSF